MNFEKFSPHLLRFAIEKELQLNNDTKIAAMIALTRLKKDPEYYHKKHGYIEMQKARSHKYIKRIPNGKAGAIDMKRNIVKIYDNLYFRLQKARTHKYIKRIPKPSGKGFLYFYTQQQVKDFKEKGIVPREEKTSGLFSGILSFFGLKDERQAKEKVQAEYSKHKETLSGISEVDFSSHLNEYLTNKKMWDAKIAGKKKAPTKSVNKKTGKVVKKGGGGEKKSGFKLSVMKTIAGIYGGSEETKSAKSAVMSDEAEKDFSAEIKNIIGKGYWNGTIYGGKRGYSVYVDNKKVEITKEEKEKIENLQKNIEEGIDDNNQTVIAKKLKEDAIKDIKSFVQLNVGEPFNPEIKELNKNLTRDSSIEKVLENVLHKLKQINDPTFWIENKDKQAMDFPDLLIDTGHLSENFQEVPLAEQTKEHVKGSREELYKKSYLTEKITQSAKGPDFIPTKDEIGQKEASIDLMSSSTIDDNTKINFIVDKQTKRPLVAEWIDKELEIEGKILSKNNMDLAFDNFKEWMNPSKKEETKSAKSAVMSEEEYLESKGASKGKTGEAALHKNRGGMSDKQWSKMVDSQAEKDRKILEKRDELRKEYKEKVEKGEIKPPTRIESLIRTAQGHEDNEATKAAQKLLKKRGIDWEKPNEKRDIMSEEGSPGAKGKQSFNQYTLEDGSKIYTGSPAKVAAKTKSDKDIISWSSTGWKFHADNIVAKGQFTNGMIAVFDKNLADTLNEKIRKKGPDVDYTIDSNLEIKKIIPTDLSKYSDPKFKFAKGSGKNNVMVYEREDGQEVAFKSAFINLFLNNFPSGKLLVKDERSPAVFQDKNGDIKGVLMPTVRREDKIKKDKESFEKATKEREQKPMNKAYIKIKDNLYIDLSKAKAVPVGTISKDGRTKKAAEGKWVPVGKDKPKKTDDKSPDNKSPELDEKNKGTIKNVLKRVASILAEALSGKDTVSPTGTTIEEAGESATAKKKKIPTGKDTKKE